MDDLVRLTSVLEQIANRDVKDVTEAESDYCKYRGWAIHVPINGRCQLALTHSGKVKLKALQRWSAG